jgi:hypothetical protein
MLKRIIPVLSVLYFTVAGQAQAGYVEIFNHTQHVACFAKTTSFYNEGEGVGNVTIGFDCVAPRKSYRFDIEENEYINLSAIDETGADFLQYRLHDYSSVVTWGPAQGFDAFGVETVSRTDGTLSLAFKRGGGEWSADEIFSNRDDLMAALTGHGFRQLTGRVFRGADAVGGVAILINF